MKLGIKIIMIVMIIFVLINVIDMAFIFFTNEPIFAISKKEDDVEKAFYGLFYDTYQCSKEEETRFKMKWEKFDCDVGMLVDKKLVYGKVIEVSDEYFVVQATQTTDAVKLNELIQISLIDNPIIFGAKNIDVGQEVIVTPHSDKKDINKNIIPKEVMITVDKEDIIPKEEDIKTEERKEFEVIDKVTNCSQELEKIYSDNKNDYYLSCLKSDQVYIEFNNGEKYLIKEALEKKYVTPEEIISKGYKLIVETNQW